MRTHACKHAAASGLRCWLVRSKLHFGCSKSQAVLLQATLACASCAQQAHTHLAMKACACLVASDSPARSALTMRLIADQSISALLGPRHHQEHCLRLSACARPVTVVRQQVFRGGRCIACAMHQQRTSDSTFSVLPLILRPAPGNDGGITCTPCPIGTYSPGGTMEPCTPCDFGTTSPPGSTSSSQCQPVAAKCPGGQIAPVGAVSAAECVCQPGFGGACWWMATTCTPLLFAVPPSLGHALISCRHLRPLRATGDPAQGPNVCVACPVGTYSSGGSYSPCTPCSFGFTSMARSTSADDCTPLKGTACPPGMEAPEEAASAAQCACLPGYGTNQGATACNQCPAGSYAPGGSLDACLKCPFGFSSQPGVCFEVTAAHAGSTTSAHLHLLNPPHHLQAPPALMIATCQ